jgi:hypothetical protein
MPALAPAKRAISDALNPISTPPHRDVPMRRNWLSIEEDKDTTVSYGFYHVCP